MVETEVVYEGGFEELRPKNSILVEGLPGVGLVAKVAVAYLLTRVDAKRVCRLYSPYFPYIVSIKDGRLAFSFSDIYLVERKNPLLFLYGNAQPATSYGQHEFCDKILDIAQRLGCSYIVTLGGYGKEAVSDRRTVYCSSTDPEELDRCIRKVGGVRYTGQIIGAAGLLITKASERGMRNVSMLVETNGVAPDFVAAARAIESLVRLLDLKIEMGSLEEISNAYMLAELEKF